MSELNKYINKLADGQSLTKDESIRTFQIMFLGGATPAQIAALLMGLRQKGETMEELLGAAEVMRAKAVKIKAAEDTIDTCGTGGDSSGTYNISTAVAFVLAGCGIPVAKHGNRAISSKSGSSDVLKELGVKVDADIPLVELSLQEAGICFMMAPKYHQAMKHVAPVRLELGMRTIFNLVGPLSNPACVKYQLLGVFAEKWLKPMAEVLRELGTKRAWVVHGSDGMDELTTTGVTKVAELKDGEIRMFDVTPEDAGLPTATLEDLKGGNAMQNAIEMKALLRGKLGPYRDVVLLNAAAGLMIADKAKDLKEGVALAAEAIDSGKAFHALEKLMETTHLDELA